MITEEQRQLRRRCIGGSDIGILLGVNKYKTAYQLYWDKVDPPEQITNEAVEWGNRLEAVVLGKFSEEHRDLIIIPEPDTIHYGPRSDLTANVDGLFKTKDDSMQGVIEIKTASVRNKDFQLDTVPASYLAQLQWYLGITGSPKGYLAALIGGNSYREYEVEADPELFKMMVDVAAEFLDKYLIPRNPPPVEPQDYEFIPSIKDKQVVVDKDLKSIIEDYKLAKAEADKVNANLKKVNNIIKTLVGDGELLVDPDSGELIGTCKTQARKVVDSKRLKEEFPDVYSAVVKESKSRTLRLLD